MGDGFEIKGIGAGGWELEFEQIGGWDRKLMWTLIMIDGQKVRYVENFADGGDRGGYIRMIREMDDEDRLGSRCELWETIYCIEDDGRIGNDDAECVFAIDW